MEADRETAGRLAAQTTRALLASRARARRAAARGRAGAAVLAARIDAEIERRRARRLARAGDRAPRIGALRGEGRG